MHRTLLAANKINKKILIINLLKKMKRFLKRFFFPPPFPPAPTPPPPSFSIVFKLKPVFRVLTTNQAVKKKKTGMEKPQVLKEINSNFKSAFLPDY